MQATPQDWRSSRREPRRHSRVGVRGAPLVAILLLTLAAGCTLELRQETSLVAPGTVATYTLDFFNDQVNTTGITLFTVIHIPSAWTFVSADFASTGIPATGSGTVVSDPGFVCTFGPDRPPPGAGRKAVFVRWGTFDILNPQTIASELSFAVGPAEGIFGVDFFLVAQKGASTDCIPRLSATTSVAAGAIFGDGFENGDLSAWSGSNP